MNKFFKIISTFLLIITSGNVYSESNLNNAVKEKPANGEPKILSDLAFFRKASMHLRGHTPSVEEFNQFKEKKQNLSRTDFHLWLEQKVSDFTKSLDFANVMMWKMLERTGINLNTGDRGSYNPSSILKIDQPITTMSEIFYRITYENKSWDDFWLTSEYTLKFDVIPKGYIFANFSNERLPFLRIHPLAPTENKISFFINDERVSGVFTTNSFIGRYQNSSVNKNRRRAAAIFNILLCDNMIPVIPPETNDKSEKLKLSFPDQVDDKTQTLIEELNQSSDKIHGTQKECLSCHNKLDPMGLAFQGIGSAIHKRPFAGRLVFKDSTGKSVDKPVPGIKSMIRAITHEQEYINCQLRFLWNEFIGVDVPFTKEKQEVLAREFENKNRKIQDFVKFLIWNEPAFRTTPQKSELVSYEQIRTSFKKCDSCHAIEGLPSFSAGPIFGWSQSPDEHKKIINSIWERMTLPDGDPKKMPRKLNEWNPDELESIKKWINQERNKK